MNRENKRQRRGHLAAWALAGSTLLGASGASGATPAFVEKGSAATQKAQPEKVAQSSWSLQVAPQSLGFHGEIGERHTQQLTLTNTGATQLMPRIEVASGEEFKVTSQCPSAMPPGMTCPVTVHFTPKQVGPVYGEITIHYRDQPIKVGLVGRGQVVSAHLVPQDGESANWGSVALKKTVKRVFHLHNKGSGGLVHVHPSLEVSQGQGLVISGSNCQDIIPAGTSCAIELSYTPQRAGPLQAALVLKNLSHSKPVAQLALSAQALSNADPHAEQVVLLFRGEGEHESSAIVDEKGVLPWFFMDAKTKEPTISNEVFRSGKGSIYFPGNGNGLITTTHVPFGTSDFTIEFWAYKLANVVSSEGHRHGIFAGASAWYDNWFVGGEVVGYANKGTHLVMNSWCARQPLTCATSNDTINTGLPLPLEQWTHIAYTREGKTLRSYRNGVKNSEVHTPLSMQSDPSDMRIRFGGGFHGYIDDARITIGVARYVGDSFEVKEPLPLKEDI